jgi:hypothetical protein
MEAVMLPSKVDPRWKDLLTGKTNHKFKWAAAGMCVFIQQQAVKSNTDVAQLKNAIEQVFAFFQQYEQFCREDLKAIFG